MRNLKNAALVAALAAVGCTIDARSRGNERFVSPPGSSDTDSAPDAAVPAGCVLHSDCPSGQACMNGQCAVVEPEAPDGGTPEADAASLAPDASAPDAAESESESESESEAEAEAESEPDGGPMDIGPDASESEAEAEAESESEVDAGGSASLDGGTPPAEEPDAGAPIADAGAPEADAGAPAPDAGAPSADGSVAPPADAGAPAPDAGAPDVAPPAPLSVTVVIEVPSGETVDASATFCSTFGGGWACAPFALGGETGREIRATYADVAVVEHVFNACLRLCDDPLNGVWMAYQSNGLQQRADPVVTVNDAVVPESLVTNGGLGANWRVDLQPETPDGG